MKNLPLILVALFLSTAVYAQDKKALKEVEQEIISEKEGKSKKGGVLSKLNVFGKDKKSKSTLDSSLVLQGGEKAGKYKPAKGDDAVDIEKKGLKDYRKAMDAEKAPIFKDKYGRPINSGPRFDSDKKIKKVNRRNEARLKAKAKKKPKKPSRRRYRYD